MNQNFQKKSYDLEEVRKLWRQETDDDRVFRAATKDIEEYPPETQTIIKEEAERRRAVQANNEPIPKQTMLQKTFSLVGLDYDPKETKDLESANKLIHLAFWTALIGASVTLVMGIILGVTRLGIVVGIVEGVVIFALAYGIHKRSRTCAVITFVYFVVSKIVQCVEMGDVKYILWGILYGFLFFQGIRGTFAYHRLSRSVNTAKEEIEQQESGELR